MDFLTTWMRPLHQVSHDSEDPPTKKHAAGVKLQWCKYVLPQPVRNQLMERKWHLKMTSQIKRPYTCVVKCGCHNTVFVPPFVVH